MDISKLTYTPPSAETSVADLYHGIPLEPKGYSFTGEFRPPVYEDTWLGTDGRIYKTLCTGYPRLILKPRPPRKRWIVEQTGDERRPLERNEDGAFIGNRGLQLVVGPSNHSYMPVTIREETF